MLPFSTAFLQKSVLRKSVIAWTLAVSVVASPVLYSSTSDAATAVVAQHEVSASEYSQFLQSKFKISVNNGVTRGQYIQDLATALQLTPEKSEAKFTDVPTSNKWYNAAATLSENDILSGTTVHPNQKLDARTAIYFAVKAAGLKELAYTYPPAKVKTALAKLSIQPSTLSTQAGQELAVAVDSGLLPKSLYSSVQAAHTASPSATFVETVLGQVLKFKGQYKHYLGYTSDDDIYAKLQDAYNTSRLIQAPELQELANKALEENLVTGYNVKDNRYEANFIDSLSLNYGHDDIKHAVQLIGLLRSEGISAKVQFEPKTSAFIYLKEWGEPKSTEDYHVSQIANGNYIANAKEYDLAFEFANTADKNKFQKVILAYAKKDSEDQKGLIYSSWWQPLYYSQTALKDYDVISNNKITQGNYYVQSFSLNDKSATVAAGFKALDPSVKVDRYQFWVDGPFFNYLNGDSK